MTPETRHPHPTGDPDPLARHRSTPREIKARLQIERQGLPYIAFRDDHGRLELRPLGTGRAALAIGRAADLGISLHWDQDVSGVHAELRRVGSTWVIEDLASTNGTFVNEERVLDRQRLVDRDIIRAGSTRLAYRLPPPADATESTPERTRVVEATARKLKGDEKKVLIELCRPLLEADGRPASTAMNKVIMARLSMSEGKVKGHLSDVADALALKGLKQGAKREELAREVLRLGLVSRRDLKS
jgi:pSer/pThr/pTyr-binding forkhead associated (FHA) protein